MNALRKHRVPLSRRALAVLDEAAALVDESVLVFPSPTGRMLSDATISKPLREQGVAAECSDAPREVCEIALAHVNSDRVEAAYRRTDLFERRRRLMADWARHIA